MDRNSEITVYEFTITKAALMNVDERERMFFVLLGFACNEIVVLNQMALAIAMFNKESEGVEQQAYVVQAGFVARLLIAKTFEAWDKLFGKLLFCSPFRREYELALSLKATKALDELKKFFGKNEYVTALRNTYIFHYPSHELNAAMPGIPDHDDWKIYLSKTHRNSLYYLSEMVADHAIIAEINPDKAVGYEKLVDDCTTVAGHIITLTTGCMSVFIKRHLGFSMEDGKAITMKVPKLSDVKLPFFTGSN